MKTVGLALSGGGARGFAHLGIYKALTEMGIKPSVISGTSAGSLMGAFLSLGYTPEQILDIAKSASVFGFSHLLIRKLGFFDMKAIEEIYLEHFKDDDFGKLPTPLYVTVTDIVNGKVKYFSEGKNLIKAIMASSCIPVVFEPVEIDGVQYVDGGVLNNFPVEPLVGKCDAIIGIHVNSINYATSHIHMPDLLDRSYHMAIAGDVQRKSAMCDLFIEPPDMTRFGVLDIEAADDIFGYSYGYALGLKPQIEEFVGKLEY